jgi:hypothetical protein
MLQATIPKWCSVSKGRGLDACDCDWKYIIAQSLHKPWNVERQVCYWEPILLTICDCNMSCPGISWTVLLHCHWPPCFLGIWYPAIWKMQLPIFPSSWPSSFLVIAWYCDECWPQTWNLLQLETLSCFLFASCPELFSSLLLLLYLLCLLFHWSWVMGVWSW